tara:strand:+ start:425 stop:556 length:132 start_codon:yes stop_codon:yes gene_type:complete
VEPAAPVVSKQGPLVQAEHPETPVVATLKEEAKAKAVVLSGLV